MQSETTGTDANRGTRRSFVDVARNSLGKAKRSSKDKTTRRSWKAIFSGPGNNSSVEVGVIPDAAVGPRHAHVSGSDFLHEQPADSQQEKDMVSIEENGLYHELLYSMCQQPPLSPTAASKARRRVTHDSSQNPVDFETSSPASRMSFFTRPNSFPARNPARKPEIPPIPAVEDAYAQNEAILRQLSQRIDEAQREYARQVLRTGRRPIVDISSTTRGPAQLVYTDKANQLHLNLLKQVKRSKENETGAASPSVTPQPFSNPFSNKTITNEAVRSRPPGPDSRTFDNFQPVNITPLATGSYLDSNSSDPGPASRIPPPDPSHVFLGSSNPSRLFPASATREGSHQLQQSVRVHDDNVTISGTGFDGEGQRRTMVYI